MPSFYTRAVLFLFFVLFCFARVDGNVSEENDNLVPFFSSHGKLTTLHYFSTSVGCLFRLCLGDNCLFLAMSVNRVVWFLPESTLSLYVRERELMEDWNGRE